MRANLVITFIVPFLCFYPAQRLTQVAVADIRYQPVQNIVPFQTVNDIPVPKGYTRINIRESSFGYWLRKIHLKKDKTVYLYNGKPKLNQEAQYAVLDIPIGTKDLQQCADAIMRLKAEYYYEKKQYHEIVFSDNNGKKFICPDNIDKAGFEKYLERVFIHCGTSSLAKQLVAVKSFDLIAPGYTIIKAGFPGHAVIVLDVARNKNGNTIYLLAQSYMPAQSIHILKNPANSSMSPWYEVTTDKKPIYTPEWIFDQDQLKKWEGK
jgi:hypothetical protein